MGPFLRRLLSLPGLSHRAWVAVTRRLESLHSSEVIIKKLELITNAHCIP